MHWYAALTIKMDAWLSKAHSSPVTGIQLSVYAKQLPIA